MSSAQSRSQSHAIRTTKSLIEHRGLLWELTKREQKDRYAGQMLGVAWSIGHPLFLILLYVFIFNFVFRQTVGGTAELPRDYTSYLLSGLVPWMAIQESMSRSCSSVNGKVDLVKQAVFPIEVLPVRVVLASHQSMLVSLACLIVYQLIKYQSVPSTILLLPLLLIVQLVFCAGIGCAFAAIAAYLRDLKDIVQVFSTAGIYLVPVFYLPAWVPGAFKPFLDVNPFSHFIWCYQDILYYGSFRHPISWLVSTLLAALMFVLGSNVFQRLRVGFGNVL